jgi:hypothetical protein
MRRPRRDVFRRMLAGSWAALMVPRGWPAGFPEIEIFDLQAFG